MKHWKNYHDRNAVESNERVEVILDLFREGHSAEEIADLLGIKVKVALVAISAVTATVSIGQ